MNKSILYLTVLVLLLSSCSSFKPEKEIVTVEKIVKPTIAIALKPSSIEMKNADVLVITEQNFEEVVAKVKAKQNGQFVVYALDLKSFENLAINMEQIKRYIEQQNEVILYYERSVTWKEGEIYEEVLP